MIVNEHFDSSVTERREDNLKKVFLVVLDYEENEEDMLTEYVVEATFDNQLFDLKERGLIYKYDNVEVYDIDEGYLDNILKVINQDY